MYCQSKNYAAKVFGTTLGQILTDF